MLANTLTFTIDSVAITFTRIREAGTSSVYRFRGSNYTSTVTIKQTSYKDASRGVTVKRHAVDLVKTMDPVAPSLIPEVRKSYMVIENDEVYTVGAIRSISNALANFILEPANSGALIDEEY